MTNDQAAQIIKELEMLRKLKMMELIERGHSQTDIGRALGLSQPTISRMFPNKSNSKKTKRNG